MGISKKQRQIMAFPFTSYDALICDGAIRSGKTVFMTIAFIDDAMRRFKNQRFGICGKTVDSTIKNIITPYMQTVYANERYTIEWKRADKVLEVTGNGVKNIFEVFGGKDESSFQLIQGRTLAGVLLDEVALQPRSFVEQAMARCSVEGSKMWFNCNPDNPAHWFNQEWILKAKEKNALHLHFELRDNPSLSEKIIARYENMYSGVFYLRYIKGLWVAAEGAIYTPWCDDNSRFLKTTGRNEIVRSIIGVDFGGNGSATSFVCIGILNGYKGVAVLREYYHKGITTPTDQEAAFVQFARKCLEDYGTREVYCDSAEQTLIAGFKAAALKDHLYIDIKNAKKGEIIDRIRFTLRLMGCGAFYVDPGCTHLREALTSAVYDPKHITEDKRLDDGSTNIDSLDAMEYACEPVMDAIISVSGVRP